MYALPKIIVETFAASALLEDLNNGGDSTSNALFGGKEKIEAKIISRTSGVVAGMQLANEVFAKMGGVEFQAQITDGKKINVGSVLAKVSGTPSAVLGGERTALNFLAHLSGIASLTNQYVNKIKNTKTKICCTRKTIPTLRLLQKYAVRCGGGVNHRFNLGDAILIKDNHIALAGGVAQALTNAKKYAGPLMAIEIEVDNLQQLDEVLEANAKQNALPTVAMLDNMNVADIKQAVEKVAGKFLLEASGNINLESVVAIAEAGVDFISTSQITQSVPALDLSLEV